jgi:hypothetical protein
MMKGQVKMDIKQMNLNRFENFAAEQEKLSSLVTKLTQLEETKRQIEARVTQARLADRAQAVLDGRYESRDFSREIEQLDADLDVYQRAVATQRQKLRNLRSFCSKQICDDLQADYGAIVVKLRDSARALLQAIELDEKFISEIERHGVEVSYISRVFLPQVLNKNSLEAFVKSIEDRRK